VVAMVAMVTAMVLCRLGKGGCGKQQNKREKQKLFHGVMVARRRHFRLCKSEEMYQECICRRGPRSGAVYLRSAKA
jgi:hypothetical protein